LSQGIKPAEDEDLYDSLLPEHHHLVRTLRTVEGRKFMRQVARFPQVYDRLERLSWTADGRAFLEQLIAIPEGPEVLRTLTTREGIKAMEKKLAKDRSGRNFGRPTGRIHTAAALLQRLRGKARKSD
jgi:hypothetical protein